MAKKTKRGKSVGPNWDHSNARDPDDLIFENYPGEFYLYVGERIEDSIPPSKGRYAARKLEFDDEIELEQRKAKQQVAKHFG